MNTNENNQKLIKIAQNLEMKTSLEGLKDFGIFDKTRDSYWYPLSDDGDAFRLVQKII